MMSVEVDWASEDENSREKGSLDWHRDTYPALNFHVVDIAGPGGGWPVVRITGTPDDVWNWLAVYDENSYEFYTPGD